MHLSVSQINMYLRCPLQHYFRYKKKLILPPTAALTKGKTVHSGVAYNYEQKKETRKDLPVTEVAEYTAAAFEDAEDETEWGEVNPTQAKDETINLVKVYHENIAPAIQPVEVEAKYEVEFSNNPYKLLGYIDVIDEQGIIRDTKTAGRKPKNGIASNLQLAGYAYMYQTIKGESANGVALDYVVSTKTPSYYQFYHSPTEAQIDNFLRTFANVAFCIENNIYHPNPNNFLCSPKFCGYWELCKGGAV